MNAFRELVWPRYSDLDNDPADRIGLEFVYPVWVMRSCMVAYLLAWVAFIVLIALYLSGNPA